MSKVKVEAWVDAELHRRAVEVADRVERSLAFLVRQALTRMVEEEERKS